MKYLKIFENFEQNNLVQLAIEMDIKIDNDPTYKRYEKEYMRKKMGNIKDIEFFEDMLDMMKQTVSVARNSPDFIELFLSNRNETIETCEDIIEMAKMDNEEELVSMLQEYIDLLKNI